MIHQSPNTLDTRDRPKTDFTFSAENENGPKMKFHFRPETETKMKTATYFRPKTKTKLSSSSITTCYKVMYYYVNTQIMQHKYKTRNVGKCPT